MDQKCRALSSVSIIEQMSSNVQSNYKKEQRLLAALYKILFKMD